MGIATEISLISMPAEEYHANIDAIGHSSLVKALRSPAHFQHSMLNRKETDAMAFGTAFHTALLEPEKFVQEYAVLDEEKLKGTLVLMDDYKKAATELGITGITKMKKDELKAAILACNDPRFRFREDVMNELYGGKILLDASEMERINGMTRNIRAHKGIAEKLSRGVAELSGFWVDPETGIMCKFRPDWIVHDEQEQIIGMVDAKKTRDASKDGFLRSITNFGYDLQAAFYVDGMKALTGREVPFYFAAAEDEAPHAVGGYRASEAMLEKGRAKYRAALQILKWCVENQSWPTYQPFGEIEDIDPPRWDRFSTDEE